jgi:hypothetical protein
MLGYVGIVTPILSIISRDIATWGRDNSSKYAMDMFENGDMKTRIDDGNINSKI